MQREFNIGAAPAGAAFFRHLPIGLSRLLHFPRMAGWCRLSLLLVLMFCTAAEAQPAAPPSTPQNPRVPYVPTPQEVVDRMLQMARVTPDDYLIDLGSGDGRILVTAASRHGARGFGVDINPER